MLAGLYSMNAIAEEDMLELWFPSEPGETVTLSVEAAITNDSYQVADNSNHIRRNFLGKRQYRSPAKTEAQNAYKEDDAWQGATDRGEAAAIGKGKLKSNINMFSRRPYMKRPR